MADPMRLLKPMHAVTNPAGSRAAIAYSAKFLAERYERAPCDAEGSGECVRCNTMYLVRVLRQMLDETPIQPHA